MFDLSSYTVEKEAEVRKLKQQVVELEDKLVKLEDLLFAHDTDCGNEYVRKAFEIIRYG